ncbi:hypothetical protein [Sinorhizobium meliloti]|uniref:hypothetical protein n=1 Tax=Rhizobium meliloti TaxID=382 RepID=UPI00037C9E5A|nr:hypothetical protein [Sinorhizobium meliloti]
MTELRWGCSVAVAAATLACAALTAPEVRAEKTLGHFQEITVAVADDFACGERVKIRLAAPAPASYADRKRMEQLVATLQAMLRFECESFKDVMFEGFVADQAVYRAVTSEKGGWALLTMKEPAAPAQPTGPAASTTPQEVQSKDTAKSFLPELGSPPKPQPRRPAQATPVAPSAGSDPWTKMQKTTTAGAFAIDNYNFPVLMSRLYFGEFDKIPDDEKTRSVVVSVMSALNRNCGERPTQVGLAAMRYGSRMMREMDRDPTKVLEHTLGPLAKMIQGFESGGGILSGFEAMASSSGSMIVTEGVEDGENLVRTQGCGTANYKQFARNMDDLILGRSRQEPAPEDEVLFSTLMHPSLRQRLALPDPDAVLRERQMQAYMTAANDSCTKKYTNRVFCNCVVSELKKMEFADGEWEQIGADFSALAKLGRTHQELRATVRSCNK